MSEYHEDRLRLIHLVTSLEQQEQRNAWENMQWTKSLLYARSICTMARIALP